MKTSLLPILIILFLMSCKNTNEQHNSRNNKEDKNKVIIENTNSDLEKNNMNATTKQTIEFKDLFNEGSIIKFAPRDLENTNDPEQLEFKKNLQLFEEQHTIVEDFEPDDIKLLINNETFFETKSYINSEWLNYFLNKYELSYTYNELVEIAIKQEDLEAIKALVKHKYIFSLKDLNNAKDTKEVQEFELKENKEDGYDSYILKDSKIDDILKLINKKYNSNKIQDKDGYTNLREGKNPNSSLIVKIKSGEHIEVLDNPDEEDWYLVQTNDGKKGYIHKSKIISE